MFLRSRGPNSPYQHIHSFCTFTLYLPAVLTYVDIFILLFSIALSAFFSGVEIAYVSGNKLKLELDKIHDSLQGRLLGRVTKSPSRFIGTMLIGNNISLVLYGLIMAKWLEPLLEQGLSGYFGASVQLPVLIAQTLISTLLILFLAEYVPKSVFSLNPNAMLKSMAVPMALFYYLLHLPVTFTVAVSRFILKYILRVETEEEAVSLEKTDLGYYLRQITEEAREEQAEVEHEVKILKNALDFPSVKARECMVPRTELAALEVEDPLEELRRLFISTGHSKIMIYKEGIDEIIGFVHSFDLFRKPQSIREILLPVLIVPETMLVKDIMTLFIQQHRSVAVVVDEYGGTAGILTLEDIIEEIFGEIEDEHDKEALVDVQLGEGLFRLSGRLEVDYLNDKYELGIPDSEEYETLAGFVLHHHQDLPQQGEEIHAAGFAMRMLRVSNTRIDEVELRVIDQD